MDEDEYDLQSPVGKIIQHINTNCKKPRLDNQLSEALDSFNDRINDQQKYLSNGIFKTNFAEAALFLQSCAELYGKKIDLLWDEIIGFLTRLIQYDCEHEKEHGKEINEDVINKLEERRNKFKRKRKSKKIDEPNSLPEQPSSSNTQPDTIMASSSDETSVIDAQVENKEIMQIPGWNEIQCLFEQTSEKYLPDKNNLLAILKVCAYCRMRFLQEKKLPLNTPHNQYIDEYCTFRKNFFAEAIKKWENVTLETFEDLHKVLIYLGQKKKKPQDKEKISQKNISSSTQGTKEPVINVKSMDSIQRVERYFENFPHDGLFEISSMEQQNPEKSKLFVNIEKLPPAVVNSKLRQDSGFYEFDSSNEDNNSETSADDHEQSQLSTINNSVLHISSCDNISENNEICTENLISRHANNLQSANILNLEENKENQQPSGAGHQMSEINVQNSNDEDDCDNRSIVSDHDYCSTTENIPLLRKSLRKRKISIEKVTEQCGKDGNCSGCKNVDKTSNKIQAKSHEENKCDKELMPPPAKKVKIYHKKIIKLLSDIKETPQTREKQFKVFYLHLDRRETEGVEMYEKDSAPELKDTEKSFEVESDQELSTDDSEEEEEEQEECEEEQEEVDDDEPEDEEDELDTSIENDNHNENEISICDEIKPLIRDLLDAVCHQNKLDENLAHEKEVPIGDEIRLLTEDLLNEVSEENTTDHDEIQSVIEHLLNGVENNIVHDTCINETTIIPNIDSIRRNSDTDDTMSVISDHSYCHRPDSGRNDSGFIDVTDIGSEEDEAEKDEGNIETLFTQVDNIVSTFEEPLSFDEEYQRTLRLLEQSQKDMFDEQSGRPTEAQRKEQEARDLEARVIDWQNLIIPVLNRLNEQEFDIHEYGAKIMDGIQINESKSFGKIVDGMSSSEVTRYFISSLQLANTNNIEICGVKPGGVSNDTFEIKLLSRDRYHEHLNAYQAPSRHSLKENLKRVRSEIQNQTLMAKDTYPKPKKIMKTCINGNAASYSQDRPIMLHSSCIAQQQLVCDTNNNRNKNNFPSVNGLSKSLAENPRKGKSIKRKSPNGFHISFEGSQAPQVLSAQITSPRQLQVSHWNQPSTSCSAGFLNGDKDLDERVLRKDFEMLLDAHSEYPEYQKQSTPRNDVTRTFTSDTVYSKNIGRKMLF